MLRPLRDLIFLPLDPVQFLQHQVQPSHQTCIVTLQVVNVLPDVLGDLSEGTPVSLGRHASSKALEFGFALAFAIASHALVQLVSKKVSGLGQLLNFSVFLTDCSLDVRIGVRRGILVVSNLWVFDSENVARVISWNTPRLLLLVI